MRNMFGKLERQQQAMNYYDELNLVRQELVYLRQESDMIKEAVVELENDRDGLRLAVRKLKVKFKYWEEGQRLKFEQVRWILNLLVYTKDVYIAVASQDKVLGTGWRKNRAEAAQKSLWDGENRAGKMLMKLRDEFKTDHSWIESGEEQEAEKKFKECRNNVWRPNREPQGRGGPYRGARGGPTGPFRGGGRGFRAKRARM